MASGNPNTDALLLGEDERGIYIAARGHIRANLCYPLREAVMLRLEEPGAATDVLVDLSSCRYMDSTFIGLLVAFEKVLRRAARGHVHVLRPSAECLDILRQLRLESVLLVEDRPPDPPALLEEISAAEKPGAEFILTVHEALMEASEEARKRFGLLKEMLERKIRGD